MSKTNRKSPSASGRKAVSSPIDHILTGIRVPDLPYPPGKPPENAVSDWRPLLQSCWTEQRDERVTHVIRSVNLEWSVRQVNAAYVADRIMDVFLNTSGLHPELARRVARLRFYLAWQMDLEGARGISKELIGWLDGLREWRGWSNTGGRSARALLDQLEGLIVAVSAAFEGQTVEPINDFCQAWQADADKREAQIGKLRKRLLDTEQGAAKQRKADQVARALIGRALQGRQLPEPISAFILDRWYQLLKQAVWAEGVESDVCRHGSKLLEWLVWVGDPRLSDKDKDRLYHVGEQIGDKILDVWTRAFGEPLPADALAGIEQVMVARLRGEVPELTDALPGPDRFPWDPAWLRFEPPEAERVGSAEGQWFVRGEGDREERRFFFALLPDTAEILWTNGAGVKLGLEPWSAFQQALENGEVRPLPALRTFGEVLDETVEVLAKVAEKQRLQREKAAQEARARAEALRRQKEAEERRRQEEQAAREAELERQRQEAEKQRLADQKAEQERIVREKTLIAEKQVAGLKLGGWITVRETAGDEPRRLKLAVRINASRKLVFVDRLGLNRQEFLESELVAGIVSERIRILDGSAEFDDTLTRVVGRIRVGRN